MHNVLYISYDGLTDPLGQSQILPYLEVLSQNGYRFTILSFEKEQRLQREGDAIRAIVAKAGIHWVPLSFTAHPPVLSKMWDRYRMKRAAFRLHRKTKFDLVHCRSYVAAEVGLLMKKNYGIRMLFDMRGFWADEKVDAGQWDLNKRLYRQLYRFYKAKEKAYLLQADGIVSLTYNAKAWLLQQPQYGHLAIDVIPCCADLAHFDYRATNPDAVAQLRAALGIPAQAKVLTYLGSVGGWYMIQEMLRFSRILKQRDASWIMLVLTKEEQALVEKEAAAAGLPAAAIVVTYASRALLPAYLALSDYSIFFIRNSFSKMASSPTKHAELMGMGIPVVCNAIGDTGIIVSETHTGILVDGFDADLLACKADEVLNHQPWDRAAIREAAFRYFDLQQGAQKYLALYNRILVSETAHAAL